MNAIRPYIAPIARVWNGITRPQRRTNIRDLPTDVLLEFFARLPLADMALMPQVSRRWRAISQNRALWKRLVHIHAPEIARRLPADDPTVDWRGIGAILLESAVIQDRVDKNDKALEKIELQQESDFSTLIGVSCAVSFIALRYAWISPLGRYIGAWLKELEEKAAARLQARVDKCLNSGLATTKEDCITLFDDAQGFISYTNRVRNWEPEVAALRD